jgi:hypothetical protein
MSLAQSQPTKRADAGGYAPRFRVFGLEKEIYERSSVDYSKWRIKRWKNSFV